MKNVKYSMYLSCSLYSCCHSFKCIVYISRWHHNGLGCLETWWMSINGHKPAHRLSIWVIPNLLGSEHRLGQGSVRDPNLQLLLGAMYLNQLDICTILLFAWWYRLSNFFSWGCSPPPRPHMSNIHFVQYNETWNHWKISLLLRWLQKTPAQTSPSSPA